MNNNNIIIIERIMFNELLIKEVRKRRVIWDVGSKAYRNANDVRNEWLEVAAESGSTDIYLAYQTAHMPRICWECDRQ
ncbi:unnamed protein product [Nesidiocoris tenuis]|uniref:MADF domain-containing protein n=1 Tax=Nesidiocoris tenuis TaxID=355587 RepID=A0A6H5FWG4_9HEMI|nr:unnamed protein product [Nesidiocoris tenuis]